jgi:hypothetical protein
MHKLNVDKSVIKLSPSYAEFLNKDQGNWSTYSQIGCCIHTRVSVSWPIHGSLPRIVWNNHNHILNHQEWDILDLYSLM